MTRGQPEVSHRERLLASVYQLRDMYLKGELGGEVMPEDAHPTIPKHSAALFHYFTFGMALNFQRNSYALWQAATATYEDPATRAVFDPIEVAQMSEQTLTSNLLRHRLALQPNRHSAIWRQLAISVAELFKGDIRNLFQSTGGNAREILDCIQRRHKGRFPYLSGPKIAHYWLHVMERYTTVVLQEREALSVAPDTHVIQASIHLGIVSDEVREHTDAQQIVNAAWKSLFAGTDLLPIDIHTPLWLWSRSKFRPELPS